MDPLMIFGAGAAIWTAFHFIPPRKPNYDDLILETWKQCGVITKEGLLPQKKDGAWFLPSGLSKKDIDKSIPALSYQLNADVEVEQKGKAIYLHVYPGALPTSIPYEPKDLSKYKLGLTIGWTYKKDCYVFDMNDSHPSLIVAGAPGQGKSNLIKVVLQQIADNYGPDKVKWYLIDLKLGVELAPLENYPQTAGTVYEKDKLVETLNNLIIEVRRRMRLFRESGVLKIDEYNALDIEQVDEETGETIIDHLPYLLLVIDEYAELKRNKEAEEKLQSLLQIGRAAGIRCILATQRPSSTNLSTDIRGLIADRLTFKLPDRINSEIVLDQPGAEELPCPGRCLLLHGASVIQAQVYQT